MKSNVVKAVAGVAVISLGAGTLDAASRMPMAANGQSLRAAFATSDMTRPVMTVTGEVDRNSYSGIAASGLIPLLVADAGNAEVVSPDGATAAVSRRNKAVSLVVTNNNYMGGFIETPPELDFGFRLGAPRSVRAANLPENGFEFVDPRDQDYLVGQALITYFSVDGFELGRHSIAIKFEYNPAPFSGPKVEGVIIK